MSSLPPLLDALLTKLEHFWEEHDREAGDHSQRMLNITRDTGEFLAVLVRATAAKRILEIGASNGYSTLWLAWAAQSTGGTVTTIERSEHKAGLAKENYAYSGLKDMITLRQEDAGKTLDETADASCDFIFLDSNREEYVVWWPYLKRALRPGGLLVVDNATSHPEEVAAFVELVNADAGFATSLVPVGKGEFLAVKSL